MGNPRERFDLRRGFVSAIILTVTLLQPLTSTWTIPNAVTMARVMIGLNPMSPRLIEATRCAPTLADFVTGYGGRILDSFSSITAVSALVSISIIGELRSRPDVAFVEEDEAGLFSEDTIGWGLSSVQAPEAWNSSTGHAIKVAILDTGIDYDHPDLRGVVKGGVDFTGSLHGYKDIQGHGTHMAGIIAASMNGFGTVGVAYEAELYAVKVLRDSDGWGYYSWWIKGIEWAVDNDMQVISMSLGGTTDSQALRKVIDKAYSKGLLIVAAAGNAADDSDVLYPARYDSVIAVGAVDSSSNVASFSRKGPELELVAPGVGVYTTGTGGSYVYSSGTSTAAPFVAGAAALVWAINHNLRNTQLREVLDKTAKDLGPSGRDPSYGHGLVNSLSALNLAHSFGENARLMGSSEGNTTRPSNAVSQVEYSLICDSNVVLRQGSFVTLSVTLKGMQRGKQAPIVQFSGLPSGIYTKVGKPSCIQAADNITFKVVLIAGLSVAPGDYQVSVLSQDEGGDSVKPFTIIIQENSLTHSLLNSIHSWFGVLTQPSKPSQET